MIFTNAHPIQILQPGVLTWLVGIEDTCVYPPSGVDAPALDEHALTGHVGAWKDDLTLARDLGATAVRYGASWPLVHRAPGIFDWSHLDQVVDHAVHTLGLGVVADLVHYGCPPWLTGSFTDRRFPAALAEFAGAFATRYRGVVDHLTPLNEPLTTASFCGLRGVWPPYRTGWAGWTAVTVAVARGRRRHPRGPGRQPGRRHRARRGGHAGADRQPRNSWPRPTCWPTWRTSAPI